jgi:hypothetical protein
VRKSFLCPMKNRAASPKGGVKMNKYELVYILKPSVEEEKRTQLLERKMKNFSIH